MPSLFGEHSMKILIVCKKFPYPLKDGEVIAIMNMVRGFFRAGHEVSVVAINTNKHHFDMKLLPPHISMMGRFYPVEVNTDVRKDEAFKNLFSRSSYNINRFNKPQVHQQLKEVLSEKEFDVVQLEGLYLVPYVKTIRKHSNARIAMRAHNVEHQIWSGVAKGAKGLKNWYLNILRNKLKRFEKKSLNRYDALVPVSKEDAKAFQTMGSSVPCFVAPIGMDVKNMESALSKNNIETLFHIGSLDWKPNQDGLMWFLDNVWSTVIEKHSELQFNIAGRNIPDWFRKLTYPSVNILGEVEDAQKFVRENDLMIVPLFSGSGMRVKISEAMALGKAVISTSLGAAGSGAQHNKNIVIANVKEDFVNAIFRLIEEPQSFRELGLHARQHALAHFDSDNIANQLIRFYQNEFQL